MLKFIYSIPSSIGWVLVGIVATLCVLMFIKLLVFIFGEIRKKREEEHRKNTTRIVYQGEEFEVQVSLDGWGVWVYLYEINPKNNKRKLFYFATKYFFEEDVTDLADMAMKTLQKGMQERVKKVTKHRILEDLEKTNAILLVD